MNKKKIIGIIIFILLILLLIFLKYLNDNSIQIGKKDTIYVATGGGKEDFLADKDVLKILSKKYNIDVVYDTWSNGKTISLPLIRESIGIGNENIIKELKNDNNNISVLNDNVSKYDALFTSDQRFYDYYKLQPNKEKNESDRYSVLDGGLTLNTPIIIYSWKEVCEKLISEGIVTEEDGIYYITDMKKLMNYILESKKWNDIGLDIYGSINIASTDPISSSPGATYYGLLLAILGDGAINDENLNNNLETLKTFYQKSGYMNNTPADLFERYLKTGMGGEAMIVDYEKSIIDFSNNNKEGYEQVKDDIVILYPKPTIWNSHCFAAFTENGKKLYKALQDSEIAQIAWERYGFRTGISGGKYDVSSSLIKVPKNINNTVTSLKMDYYDKLIEYLKE